MKDELLTKEQRKLSNHNNRLAWLHFYPEGKGKPKPGYVLHHIDDTLRHTDIDRYIEWRIEDLLLLTKSEHASLHSKNKSEEHKQRFSEACKGKHRSEEAKRKISEATKGQKWWTNGVEQTHCKECPGPTFVRGKLKKV